MTDAGPSLTAEAPLVNDNDNPAALNNGTAHARCFHPCFGWDMEESSCNFGPNVRLYPANATAYREVPTEP
jgi:hypothetical protein